ncbi:MAG TPA: dTMP kinase [Chthoniobacteraceae bacterium]
MQPTLPNGFLLVVEGIDGAGKSTVARALAEHCRALGYHVTQSYEPTSGQWGTLLRQSAKSGRLPLDEELELFIKDRVEHVETLIRPALARGGIVILDRYYLSTAAYQGARGADPEEILARNEEFAPKPDLVLLLDFDPAAGLERIRARGDRPDDFEGEQALVKVRGVFLQITRPFMRRIDAAQPAPDVLGRCVAELDCALEAKKRS